MDLIQFLVVDTTAKVTSCGGIDIPGKVAYVVSSIITLLKIGVPILLIIFGMLDLGKAVIASKEDEIKKGQKTFISRLIAAVIVFFVVAVVQLVVNIVADNEKSEGSAQSEAETIWKCIDDVINYNKNHSNSDGD